MQSKTKLIFFLFLLSSTLYIFNLFKITATTRRSSILLTTVPHSAINLSFATHKFSHESTLHEEEPLTLKELNLLSSIILTIHKHNRSLLFFGLNPQLIPLAEANVGRGTAIFLEDDSDRIRKLSPELSQKVAVLNVKYDEKAGRAYELLRHGRANTDCLQRRNGLFAGGSSCRLAMASLPKEIYEKSWDVVVVDGPRGNWPDAPGRMAAIYTAAVIARMGSVTEVLVHDADRMIERWFSWEFLCHENLVSLKGKLWHFRVHGSFNNERFCSKKMVQIL